jgi:hypothetical protein
MGERESGMPREQGISRRELLKRGAVVGGTMVWAVPVLQSLAPPAYAQYATCGCCYCWNGPKENPTADTVSQDGCLTFHANPDACREFCSSSLAAGGPFVNSEQCCSTNDLCNGNTRNDPGPNGCFCS